MCKLRVLLQNGCMLVDLGFPIQTSLGYYQLLSSGTTLYKCCDRLAIAKSLVAHLRPLGVSNGDIQWRYQGFKSLLSQCNCLTIVLSIKSPNLKGAAVGIWQLEVLNLSQCACVTRIENSFPTFHLASVRTDFLQFIMLLHSHYT